MISEGQRRNIINSFEPHFHVTWESERRLSNTIIDVMLLKPSKQTSETFGFENEVPLFISSYPNLQPRTMQAMEQICAEHPLAGRIDTTVAFLLSADDDIESWAAKYQSENPENRIIVPFTQSVVNQALDDKWRIINAIKDSLFIRNLFDYKLPLKSDRYFYGREDIVATIADNVKKSQNTALFGLRKTGKTSVLLKAQRTLKKSGDVHTLFIDCKSRPIRSGTCDDLARRLISLIDTEFSKKNRAKIDKFDDVLEVLNLAIQSIPSKKKLCMIFDEIEYISPISPTDSHWGKDFIDFWQALWTIQSGCDKVCFVVCGVNPTICEVDRFPSQTVADRTVQNPIFSIFNTQYLRGLTLDSTKNMIEFFGSRMGIFFSTDAIEYIHAEYGGHPLLTRLACSYHHEELMTQGAQRPVTLKTLDLQKHQVKRDSELSSYCGHVVSEIEELYKDEYNLLKALAAGEVADFYESTKDRDAIRHIRDYGLVDFERGIPTFKIPVVRQYLRYAEREAISLDEANKFSTQAEKHSWLSRRARTIADDIVLLDAELRSSGRMAFYTSPAAFKAHHFIDCPLVLNETDAVSFLVHSHKLLVEPIDKFLKNGVARNQDFSGEFPSLRRAFMRLKSYRNWHCHVDISPETEAGYRGFLETDLDGRSPDEIEDGWFKMQRRILDNIHVALQAEISKL